MAAGSVGLTYPSISLPQFPRIFWKHEVGKIFEPKLVAAHLTLV